jgi:hypothetical protein
LQVFALREINFKIPFGLGSEIAVASKKEQPHRAQK